MLTCMSIQIYRKTIKSFREAIFGGGEKPNAGRTAALTELLNMTLF